MIVDHVCRKFEEIWEYKQDNEWGSQKTPYMLWGTQNTDWYEDAMEPEVMEPKKQK